MTSLSTLVEPLVSGADGLSDEVRLAASALLASESVALDHLGALAVTAVVADDDGEHRVALGSTAEGLAARCDCELGATGRLCPHSLATAIETWHQSGEPGERD